MTEHEAEVEYHFLKEHLRWQNTLALAIIGLSAATAIMVHLQYYAIATFDGLITLFTIGSYLMNRLTFYLRR